MSQKRSSKLARRRARARARYGEYRPPAPPGHTLDCGCPAAALHPLGNPLCPGCGQPPPSDMLDALRSGLLPTSAEPGSLVQVEHGCRCGREYLIDCEAA